MEDLRHVGCSSTTAQMPGLGGTLVHLRPWHGMSQGHPRGLSSCPAVVAGGNARVPVCSWCKGTLTMGARGDITGFVIVCFAYVCSL